MNLVDQMTIWQFLALMDVTWIIYGSMIITAPFVGKLVKIFLD